MERSWAEENLPVPPTLEAAVAERNGWVESAMRFSWDADYYRGLVVKIGELLGPEAYVSDDGTVQADVLCAKVPELVADRLTTRRAMALVLDKKGFARKAEGAMAGARELSKGEVMVRLSFNPAGDADVLAIKQQAAACIDFIERFRDRDARCCALAQTAFEDAAMWAVKCVTTGKP